MGGLLTGYLEADSGPKKEKAQCQNLFAASSMSELVLNAQASCLRDSWAQKVVVFWIRVLSMAPILSETLNPSCNSLCLQFSSQISP